MAPGSLVAHRRAEAGRSSGKGHNAVSDMMRAFAEWTASNEGARSYDFRTYVRSISEARFVIRKIFRIADEQAKRYGLEPLQHQALLHVYAAGNEGLPVSRVAERLDIAAALASRLSKELERFGYVQRTQSTIDRRSTSVTATDGGAEVLRKIDTDLHLHVQYFQRQLGEADRMAALAIFAFYVGLAPDSTLGEMIRSDADLSHGGKLHVGRRG